MNKNYIIFIIFLVCISFVSGYSGNVEYDGLYLSDYLVHGYHFNNSNTDIAGINDCIVNTSTYSNSINVSYNFSLRTDAANEFCAIPNSSNNFGPALSWCGWFNSTKAAGNIGMLFSYDDWAVKKGGMFAFYYPNDNRIAVKFNNGVQHDFTNAVYPETWTHYCITYEPGNLSLYVNASFKGSKTANVPVMASNVSNIEIGLTTYVDQDIQHDEWLMFNTSLSLANVTVLFNGDWSELLVPDNLNITAQQPANNTQFNQQQVPINVTLNTNSSFVNCTLFLNNTANYSINNIPGAMGLAVNFTANFTSSTEWFGNYTVQCKGDQSTALENSSVFAFYVDMVFPTISTNFTNRTTYYNLNFSGNVNFTDDFQLHSVNMTINGVTYYNRTGLSSKLHSLNFTFNTSGFPLGENLVVFTATDGHTAKELKGDYEWGDGLFNNYLWFEPYGKNRINIYEKDSSFFDRWDTARQKDRYTFDYSPVAPTKSHYIFVVESDLPIFIYDNPETPWKKWIVTGDNWLDFMSEEEVVSITRISDYEVEFDVTNKHKKDKIRFSSIGDLNTFTANYSFYKVNATEISPDPVAAGSAQTFSLNLSTNSMNATNATFYFNGTNRSITKTSGANYDYYEATVTMPQGAYNFTLNWTFNWTTPIGVLNANITDNLTVVQIGIDNCTTFYPAVAVNITLRNESDNAYVRGTVEGHFWVWTDDEDNDVEFNLTWNDNYSGICISPNTSSYQIDAQFEYDAVGFSPKNYYFNNVTLNNVTKFFNFYLTDGTTPVTTTIIDQNDDPVTDVFLEVLSYDIATDSFITTEITAVDDDGKTTNNLILYDQWYKFQVKYGNGSVLYVTPVPRKITTTTQTIRITIVALFTDTFTDFRNIMCGVSFNNVTNNFAFAFTDPTGTSNTACLNVKRINAYLTEDLNTSCVTSASGTILVNIGTRGNYSYRGTGSITVDGETFICAMLEEDYNQLLPEYGNEGLFASFMLILTLTMIGLFNPLAAIAVMIFGIIITKMLGIFLLDWTYVISIIILGGLTMYRLRKQ